MAAIALERGCILVALAAGSTHQNRPLPPDDVMFVRERGQASGQQDRARRGSIVF